MGERTVDRLLPIMRRGREFSIRDCRNVKLVHTYPVLFEPTRSMSRPSIAGRLFRCAPSTRAGPSTATLCSPRRKPFAALHRHLNTNHNPLETSFYAPSYPPRPVPSNLVPSADSAEAQNASHDEEGSQCDHRIKKTWRHLDSLMDKAGELSLRCSILDSEGNWTAEEGRYKKTELCREYDLDPRDLRKLDSLSPNLVPLILSRKKCILISMLHIRALVKPDRVIVFDTAGTVESEVQKRFKWHLERNIKAGLRAQDEGEEVGLVYEHRALESILLATANALEEEMVFTRQLVQQLLADLEGDINRDNLKRLLHYSRRMVGFQSRARYVKRAVDEVLESDEDLSAMYLTSRARGQPRALHDHEQLELLFESFVKQVEEIVSEVDTTVANMQSTQEIAELMLDSGRNALLALDVKLSIATLGIGTGALVAGIFGMNLHSQLENHPSAFYIISGGAGFVAFMIMSVGMRKLRKIRRIALSDTPQSALDRLMSAQAYDQALASLAHGPPSLPTPAPKISMTNLPLWTRLFKRRIWAAREELKGPEPVWINKKADMARARDAWRAHELAMKEAQRMARRNKDHDWQHGGDDPWKWPHKDKRFAKHY
ncbi:hypothetical protein BD324DRAFT_639740 [Kockovaella imperatae]|uniref:Magnesium transporter n=1 Tax=Kockovaella imperatae TaxID=4999 RepID=A0A1Y1U5X3_9TREE|nr:hypothetical protein BD324DRAFT_639740 [Kockovaella imperatae]ORX33428.1 hypothetical protein BD324DRAFT_639740 [Kockovaella imperatae]